MLLNGMLWYMHYHLVYKVEQGNCPLHICSFPDDMPLPLNYKHLRPSPLLSSRTFRYTAEEALSMIEIIFEILVKHNSKYYMFTLQAKIRIFFKQKYVSRKIICFSVFSIEKQGKKEGTPHEMPSKSKIKTVIWSLFHWFFSSSSDNHPKGCRIHIWRHYHPLYILFFIIV